MPIGRFTKCLSGNLTYVSKNKYYSNRKVKAIWEHLFNQHLEAHGLPDNYVQYINKMTKAIEFYNQSFNGKKWQVVRAKICEAEAIALLSGEGEKIEKTCAILSKHMIFPVRANECTVVEFYNYVAIVQQKQYL